MPKRSVTNATFVLERTDDAPPARTFAAQADPATQARWFVGPGDWRRERRELDVGVEGSEHRSGPAVRLDRLGAERQHQLAGSRA